MDLIKETKYLMNKYHIYANKSFGQNFLVDEDTCLNIVESAKVSKEDLIIEIGPGLGTLTSFLLEKAGKVICIELDKKMLDILNDRFSMYDNFELINDDCLKVDINSLISSNSQFKTAKVVANLPYYITTPIIMKLLESNLKLESITVMVQKEVAERLTEKPGGPNTGAITYSIDYYTDSEIVLNVPKESFMPSPKVDSAVINLKIAKSPKVEVKDAEFLFKVIKTAFLQKRKTLVNSLSNNNISSRENIEVILNSLNIDTKIRAEKLSLQDFANITNMLLKQKA